MFVPINTFSLSIAGDHFNFPLALGFLSVHTSDTTAQDVLINWTAAVSRHGYHMAHDWIPHSIKINIALQIFFCVWLWRT